MNDADAFYTETRKAVREGTYVAKEHETVSDAVTAWLAGRRNIRPSTLAGYRDALKPVTASYGSLPIQRLTKAHIDQLVNELEAGSHPAQRRPWKPRTVRLMLFALGKVLDDLMRQGRLARNVAALVDPPARQSKEMRTWTAEDVTRFLASVRSDRMLIAWLLALYGLRRGEIAGLRWDDIDFNARSLRIRRARMSVDGQAQDSPPKTERGARRLPLTADLVDALRGVRRQYATDRLAAGSAYDDSSFVVVDPVGQPLHPDTITKRWNAAVKAARVPAIRLHDARHTCGTLMHLRGVPTVAISAWLGHSSAAFTMRTYVHSPDHALQDAAETLGDVMRSVVTKP